MGIKGKPFYKKGTFPTCLCSPSHGRLLGCCACRDLAGEGNAVSVSYQNHKARFIFWHRVGAALGCILTPFTPPPPLSGGTTSEAHIDLSPQILTARAAVIPCLHLPGFCAVLQHLLNPASRNRTFQSYFATRKWSR